MKRHLLLLFLLHNLIAFGQQEEDFYIVKFKETNAFFANSFNGFYIDSIIDNRAIKSSHLGIVKKGFAGRKRIKAKFENDTINAQIKALFKKCKISKKGRIPIIAVINFFEIGEFQSNTINEEGFVYLDIDYFSKESNGILTKVGHFHGKEVESLPYDVTSSHPERICHILVTSLKTVKPLSAILETPKANYNDTTYVPKEGFYRSFLDYQYNTPIITQKKYKISTEDFRQSYLIKVKSDSLVTDIFGYSDGRNFYTNGEQGFWFSSIYKIVTPKGRFLFMTDAMLELSSNEVAKKTLKAAAFPISISANAKNGNIVFDLVTGRVIQVNSYNFGDFLKQEDEVIYEEYRASKKTTKDTKIAIEKLNSLYHNKPLQH